MVGYVYMTTNLINGMRYIGKHKSDRFVGKTYIGSGALLKKAIAEYGRNNFICELIESCDTLEDLDVRERYWISYYNATEDKEFYNIAEGGTGSSGIVFGQRMAEAWKDENYRNIHIEGNKRYWKDPENHRIRTELNRKTDHKSVWTSELRNQQSDKQKIAWSNSELIERHRKHMKGIWSNPEMIEAQRERNTGSSNPSYGKHYYVDGSDHWIYCKPEDVPDGYYRAKYSWIYKDGQKLRHESAKPIPDGWSLDPNN